ncbi:MAG: glycosyltransferase family 4 protein, partial [Bacteroidales bacterium]|nr:glycosyltransferase family 4 protein [Bacteroidales bacterium]
EIPSNVKFFGFLDKEQLNQFYLESKLLLFLSNWYEGFSMVVIEAMKRGVPVVAYDILAAKDVVENGKNGFIVSFKDYDAIVSTIELLFSDDTLFESLSAFARERVVGEYSENRYYERLIDIVKSEIDKDLSL